MPGSVADGAGLLQSGKAAWIYNPISAYRTIETQNKDLASKIVVDNPLKGPKGQISSIQFVVYGIWNFSKNIPAAQQFSGGNLLRLNAARGMVDPAFAASGKVGSPYLMGSLQSELVKARPNAELAGTYLGLVAKVPVTAATVKSIGSQLCAVVSDAQAQEIAQVAEQQRLALISAAPAGGGAGHGKAQ